MNEITPGDKEFIRRLSRMLLLLWCIMLMVAALPAGADTGREEARKDHHYVMGVFPFIPAASIEGLFARIERWTDRTNGEIHWRSISKDNITTLYGKDNNSRIFDPAELDPAGARQAETERGLGFAVRGVRGESDRHGELHYRPARGDPDAAPRHGEDFRKETDERLVGAVFDGGRGEADPDGPAGASRHFLPRRARGDAHGQPDGRERAAGSPLQCPFTRAEGRGP